MRYGGGWISGLRAMRILKEYRLCEGFHGDNLTAVIDLPSDVKVIEAYCKGSVIFLMAAINPSDSWLIKRKFMLFKDGARLPSDDELKETSLCGLVQMSGLSPIIVLECPVEEISTGDSNIVKE